MSASVCPSEEVPISFCCELREAIPTLRSMGYTGIELLLSRAEDIDVPSLERLLSKSEMELPAIGTGLAVTEGLSLSSQDEGVRRKTVERITSFSRLADRLNSRVVIGSIRGGASQASTLASLEKSFSELGDLEALIEPLNRYECRFINTASEALEFIRRNGLHNSRVLLDTFHMNIEESSLADAIRKTGKMLGHVHVADSNRRAPGYGHIAFNEVFDALGEIEYGGFLSLEMFQVPSSGVALEHAAEFINALAQSRTH